MQALGERAFRRSSRRQRLAKAMRTYQPRCGKSIYIGLYQTVAGCRTLPGCTHATSLRNRRTAMLDRLHWCNEGHALTCFWANVVLPWANSPTHATILVMNHNCYAQTPRPTQQSSNAHSEHNPAPVISLRSVALDRTTLGQHCCPMCLARNFVPPK